ncbi:hypothetical protein [Mycobacterium talmoniae]|uniref:Uncharacterized protein n=1 Tax=Mycobacterium talmoniae TaxID=1858794 RepID=A0A1S1MQJ3_9MYCO|nr:hypothetical protein [Mycobacterium talmoniae]OHU90516.1 hypothetical protein BKN37_25530 [Mycobacterium talmoniae]
MLGAIAIIPSAPVLVPELVGAAAAELTDLRDAVLAAAAALPPRWVALGAGATDAVVGPDLVGTFAGFGADVRVRLSPRAAGDPVPVPLCALVAGWVRGQTHPDAAVQVRVYGDDVAAARGHGRRLRAELDATADPIGVLVLADGATTLTAAAPGGYRPGDGELQHRLDDALAGGATAALTDLPAQVAGRVGYAALAGLAEPGPRSAKELYCGAPYGVGYFAGVWQP